jgi:hypothetical protein
MAGVERRIDPVGQDPADISTKGTSGGFDSCH